MEELLPSSCEWIDDETGQICGQTPASYQGLLFVPNRASIISIRYVCEEHALKYGPPAGEWIAVLTWQTPVSKCRVRCSLIGSC